MLDGQTLPVFQQPEPGSIDWSRAGAEVVVEASGSFLRRTAAAAHLGGTVRWVVLSANSDPADPADATICLGRERRVSQSGRPIRRPSDHQQTPPAPPTASPWSPRCCTTASASAGR